MCTMKCPVCKKPVNKLEPKDDFICPNCGWKQNKK